MPVKVKSKHKQVKANHKHLQANHKQMQTIIHLQANHKQTSKMQTISAIAIHCRTHIVIQFEIILKEQRTHNDIQLEIFKPDKLLHLLQCDTNMLVWLSFIIWGTSCILGCK